MTKLTDPISHVLPASFPKSNSSNIRPEWNREHVPFPFITSLTRHEPNHLLGASCCSQKHYLRASQFTDIDEFIMRLNLEAILDLAFRVLSIAMPFQPTEQGSIHGRVSAHIK